MGGAGAEIAKIRAEKEKTEQEAVKLVDAIMAEAAWIAQEAEAA